MCTRQAGPYAQLREPSALFPIEVMGTCRVHGARGSSSRIPGLTAAVRALWPHAIQGSSQLPLLDTSGGGGARKPGSPHLPLCHLEPGGREPAPPLPRRHLVSLARSCAGTAGSLPLPSSPSTLRSVRYPQDRHSSPRSLGHPARGLMSWLELRPVCH